MFRIACALPFAMLATVFALPVAAAYPEKAIRLLIPFPPGGGTDILARALQDKIEAALGAPLIIDNRGGAGGTLGCTLAARAAPDGYTLLLTSASFSFAPSLYKDLAYDAVKDFKPITNFAQAPLVLAVHPSLPVLNVRELLDLARKRPGEIQYDSAGRGSNQTVMQHARAAGIIMGVCLRLVRSAPAPQHCARRACPSGLLCEPRPCAG